MNDLESLKYPIGKYQWLAEIPKSAIKAWVSTIEKFPELIASEVSGLSEEALDWKYRPEGWNVRQVIHHCADSHFNSFVIFKLTITEDTPTIKPYNELKWSMLADSSGPVKHSIKILEGLHSKWALLLKSLDDKTLKATYFHPERNQTRALDSTIGLYAWHCDHHLAHIRQAKAAKGKY